MNKSVLVYEVLRFLFTFDPGVSHHKTPDSS